MLLKAQNPCLTCMYAKNKIKTNSFTCFLCDYMHENETSPCGICPSAGEDKSKEGSVCDSCKLRIMYNNSTTDPRLLGESLVLKSDRRRIKKIERNIKIKKGRNKSPAEKKAETTAKIIKASSKDGYGENYIDWIFDLMIEKKVTLGRIALMAGVVKNSIITRLPKRAYEMAKVGTDVIVCIKCGNLIPRKVYSNGQNEPYSEYFNRKTCSKCK